MPATRIRTVITKSFQFADEFAPLAGAEGGHARQERLSVFEQSRFGEKIDANIRHVFASDFDLHVNPTV